MLKTRGNITLEKARKALDAAVESLKDTPDLGPVAAIAVVDSGGHLVAFARTDGVDPACVQISQNKAHTAIRMGRDTTELEKMIEHVNISWFGDPRLCPIPGGVLIKDEDGSVVGAIGTSGRSPQGDEATSQAGAKAAEG